MRILAIIVINSKCIAKLPITKLGFYFSFLLDYWVVVNGERTFPTAGAHISPICKICKSTESKKKGTGLPMFPDDWHHGSIWFEDNRQTCLDSTHFFWMDPFKTSFSTEKYYLRDSNAFLGEEGNKPFHQVNLIWFYISSNFYLHLCEDPFYSEMPCTRLRRNLQCHKEHRRPIF